MLGLAKEFKVFQRELIARLFGFTVSRYSFSNETYHFTPLLQRGENLGSFYINMLYFYVICFHAVTS